MNERTILVVEDDPEVALLVATVLRKDGITVTSARNGAEAIDYLRTWPKTGLVLLDLGMPRMSGVEFLKARSGDPELSRIKVILLSGHPNLGSLAAEYSVEHYLSKTDATRSLFSLVRDLLLGEIEKGAPSKCSKADLGADRALAQRPTGAT